MAYATNASGVPYFQIQELIYPEFQAEKNYNEEFWKTYLKN